MNERNDGSDKASASIELSDRFTRARKASWEMACEVSLSTEFPACMTWVASPIDLDIKSSNP